MVELKGVKYREQKMLFSSKVNDHSSWLEAPSSNTSNPDKSQPCYNSGFYSTISIKQKLKEQATEVANSGELSGDAIESTLHTCHFPYL